MANKITGAEVVGATTYQLPSGSIVITVVKTDTTTGQPTPNINPGANASRRTSWRELTQ